MKHIHTLLTALLTATAMAERTETIILYQGTPDSVHWGLNKSGFNRNLQGDIAFAVAGQPLVPHNTFGLSFQRPTWEIPPFDTKDGTRIPTGVSVRLAGQLGATFRGSAAGRDRNIEGVFQHAKLQAEIRKPGSGSWETSAVLYHFEAGESHNIEALPNPQPELVWNVTTTVNEEGRIDRGTNTATIAGGGSSVNLGGYLFWMPFYKLDGQYIDCGTDAWEIPDETATTLGIGYPVDELGRNLQSLYGTTQYPAFDGPQFLSPYRRETIYGRTGTASPMSMEVTYYYQDVADTDFGQDPYAGAGAYKDPFKAMDTTGSQNSNKAFADFVALQGNRSLEVGEWLQAANDYSNTKGAHGGLALLWQADANGNALDNGSKDARRLFYWTDANGDEKVSMEEYTAWRELIKASTLREIDPFTLFPRTDEEFTTRISPETVLAEVIKIDIPEVKEPIDSKTPTGAVFIQIDKNSDGWVSHGEWIAYFYAKPPKKETAFAIADTDKNKQLSFEEFERAAGIKGPAALIMGNVSRAAAFLDLDADKNQLVDRSEIALMWAPGTAAKNIDTIWKRIGGTNFTMVNWLNAKTLPSLGDYQKAKVIRADRLRVFKALDVDLDNCVSREEYSRLFPVKTKPASIDASWATATGTPKKGTPPAKLEMNAFVESIRLPKLRIY